MSRKPKTRRSFFKILIKDYASRISFPPAFVHKYRKFLPENAKLRTSSGETWDVKFEEVEDEKYCFTHGWTKFVEDVELELGEFVVFWFNVGKSTFDVSVYGISGCKREISAKPIRVEDYDDDDNDDDDGGCEREDSDDYEEESDGDDGGGIKNNQTRPYVVEEDEGGNDGREHPHFKLLLKKHHFQRVSIHKEFAVATGLVSERAVVLQYPPKKRCWPVLLYFPKLPFFRVDISSGWGKFRRQNGLMIGKSYLFEYIKDKNVIEVKLLNGGN